MSDRSIDIRLENHKAFNEYLRFLVTLSTGSIVVLISFIQQLAAQPKFGSLISVALIAFMISIISCVSAYTIAMIYLGVHVSEEAGKFLTVALLLAWVSFLVAVVSLTIFGVANLQQ